MSELHGFELIRAEEIHELNSTYSHYRHMKTGAELISMENDDENKCFGITFRTPPNDSTGIAHILEHITLAGSRKYRVKEPFIELIKGSLKTFVNAFTYPDKTVYPVASQNLQDFYNLIDVYLDSVFYPLLSRPTFHQEGWHYEIDDPSAPLTYKGVVFNEMKGAYSDPDDLLEDTARRSLFPDTIYGFDSGGDPRHIPNLTYSQLRDFHQRYYHPSNARIWFYGDDPADERLRLLDRWLRDFEPIQIESSIPLQSPFSEPRWIEQPFAAGEDGKPYLVVSWMLTETEEAEVALGLSILAYILIGTPASPLRKALIDSGLGQDLAGSGMEGELRQLVFSTGLKGIHMETATQVESLILDTLHSLADDGIDPRTVEAAINTIEFSLRERNTGGFPRGIAVMLAALTTWLYGRDPLTSLAFETPLAAIKERIAGQEPYFETLIRTYFLGNNHRTTVVLRPDSTLQERLEREEEERLAVAKAAMSPEELQTAIDDTLNLHRIQETPDDPEALAAIPRLTLADLDREGKGIAITVSQYQDSQILFHDLFTNGITYLDVGMNLRVVPQALLPYVGLLGSAFLQMGTEKEDFVSLSQRIGAKTGGIRKTLLTSSQRLTQEPVTWLLLRGKAMADQTDDLLAILQDILLSPKLDDQERFRQILLETKASLESSLLPGGHGFINSRLRSHFDLSSWVAEQMNGLDYLQFLRRLLPEVEQDWPAVVQRLQTLRSLLVNRENMLWNVTLEETFWQTAQPRLHALIDTLPGEPPTFAQWMAPSIVPHEAFTIPAQVNYVSKGADLYKLGYTLDGSIHVVVNYLATSYLWEKVRMQGGAYGGFSTFDQQSGVFSFLSYRDPNLGKTLHNYDGTASFLRNLTLNKDELTKAIIGVIGSIDTYRLPDAKGYVSLVRHLLGETDAMRQERREQVLETAEADFHAFADLLDRLNEHGHIVVLGSEGAVTKANGELATPLEMTRIL